MNPEIVTLFFHLLTFYVVSLSRTHALAGGFQLVVPFSQRHLHRRPRHRRPRAHRLAPFERPAAASWEPLVAVATTVAAVTVPAGHTLVEAPMAVAVGRFARCFNGPHA